MRSDEIERLLGGYATNTLTDGERKVLYEAALDDQELFNALEDEEALRDLLADRESRRKIETALKQVPQQPPVRSWFSRPWAWGLAGSLAAACALVFVLSRLSEQPKPRLQIAQGPLAAAPFPPPPVVSQLRVPDKGKPVRQVIAAPQRAVASLLANKVQSPQPAGKAEPANVQSDAASRPAVFSNQAGFSSVRGRNLSALPITVLRGGTLVAPGALIVAGDMIQFQVRAPLSGKVTLTRDGVEVGTPLMVTAGAEYTLPGIPIAIDGPSRFRLVMSSVDGTVQTAEISLAPGKPL